MKNDKKILVAAVLGLMVFSGNSVKAESDYAGLKAAIANATQNTEYTYNLENSITGITEALGTMQGTGYALTIDGNNFGISGNGAVEGVRVQEGQSLILKNIGAYTTTLNNDGKVTSVTVTDSMNGFRSPSISQFGAVYNNGTTTVANSVFSNNTGRWGGALNNGGTMTITNSVFAGNISTYNSEGSNDEGGGALHNKSNAAITNSIFYGNQAKSGGAIYNGTNGVISLIDNSQFVNNELFSPASSGNFRNFTGGAIHNAGQIDKITNSYFYGNKTYNQGAAISNFGHIDEISDTIIENNVSTTLYSKALGGAIYNYHQADGIDKISNVHILNNTGDGINSNALINEIINSKISGNSAYGIQLDSSGNITTIENTEISNNTLGGIKFKGNTTAGAIKNSSFLNNGSANKEAGAIWLNKADLKIQADNGTTIFKGNIDNSGSAGIWVNTKDTTLTLEQINSGDMYFYDLIKGSDNFYNVNITGDGTGTLHLYNNIKNAKISTTNTNIDTADGNLFGYEFRSLLPNTNTNWKIDVDFANAAADTFKVGIFETARFRTINLKDFNFINGGWESLAVGDSITKNIRVLTSPSVYLQLSLDDSLSGENIIAKNEIIPASSWDDEVGTATAWTDNFYHWDKDATNEVITGEYSLTTTGTTNDTLTIEVTKSQEGGDVHQGDKLGDALVLVNQATSQATKSFNAVNDGDSYVVAANTALGNTKGTVNINGVHGGDAEIVNLNNNTGFVLGDGATALNFKDVTVGGTDTVATVSNSSATVKLEDSILNGAITGTGESNFNMTTAGTSEINADVTNAIITNSGTLTTTGEHTNDSIIKNYGTLFISGLLNNNIQGTGTTKVNSSLTLASGKGNIDGTFDLNGGSIVAAPEMIDSFTFGSITGNGNIAIDMRLSDGKVDLLTARNQSSGTITLSSVNIVDPSTEIIDKDFLAYILDVPSGSTIQLALSQAVQEQFEKAYIIAQITPETTIDPVLANSSWTQGLYKKHTKAEVTVYGQLALSDDKHSIVVKESRREGGQTTHTSRGDTLMLVNQDTNLLEKNFTAQADGMTYTVEDDLGYTYGIVNINGVHGGEAEIVNLNNNAGFVLGFGAKALNFKDVTVGGADTIATVNWASSNVNLEDAILNGKITGSTQFKMTTSGTSEINADVTKANISNTGILTTTAEHIANSTITNVKDDTNNIDSTLILSGALAKEILGGGTTKINSSLTFNDGAAIAGTLNMNGGNLAISDGSVTNHTVGNISGSGNISLDFDGTNIDTITLTNDTSAATLTIASLSTPANTTDFEQQVLFGADSNTVLALSDDVLEVYNKTFDKDMSGDTDLSTSTIKWNDNYGTEEWTETYKSELSVTGSSAGLMDTLLYETSLIGESEHVWNPKADNLRLINVYTGQGAEDRTFIFDTKDDVYTVTRDLGTTTSGTLSVLGKAESDGDSSYVSTIDFNSHKGFDLDNDDTTLNLKDVGLINADYIAKSGKESSVINLDGVILDGSNGEGIETSGSVNIFGGSVVDDKITLRSVNSSINVDGSDEVSLNGKFTGVGELNLENGSVYFGDRAQVSGLDTNMSNVNVTLENENSLSGVNLTVDSPSSLNMMNGSVGTLALNNVTLNGALNMTVDADLANRQMDKITAVSATVNDVINVQKINLLSPTTEKNLSLLFTDNKNLANAVNYKGEGTIAYSPIYKYKTSYDVENDMGYFKFGLVSGGHSPSDFNPAVLASPVMAQAGLMQSMNATMHYAFEHSDGFTKFNARDRFAKINANRYAIQSTDFNENLQLNSLYENRGIWAIPYASFENVHLKNGPRVDVNSYGTFAGFDTDIKQLKHGWNTVSTGYIGYNGAHMSYNGVSTNMNGGMIGATQTWYKGNFWTALTATVGASVADSDTMYGHEDYTSILSGVGSKTGYNFELADGKFIIQPIWFMNYSLMKTFDYTNAAGVRINSNPISTIQLNPSVRFIGNLKYGWQPYASVGMVWNLMNETHVRAAGVKLPEMSVKPYVQYGVGVQKQMGDSFTGYMQAMLHNGGRNGIALTGGFRWTLGKKKNYVEKVENNQNNSINISESTPKKKVIKQL